MRGMTIDLIDDILVHRLPVWRRSHRIAIVTETYPPEVNGVAMSLARLVAGLHSREHELQLVRPRQRENAPSDRRLRFEEFLTGGWPIPSYPNLRMGVPSKRALVHLWSLRRPDVVHIATEGPLGWSALQAARHLKLPVTSDFRTNFHAYGQHYRVGWLARPIMAYLRKFHNRTACTMVPTESLRAQLSALGFERLHVVGRGVDTRLFSPQRRSEALRKEWGVAADAPVMVCVGRLAPEKNLKTVLEAYAALAGVRPDAKLVFVGDGPMRAELQARCPQAILAGQRHGEDLAAHYASADLFVFPSLTETYGNVTAEAMASGLAVVAFHCAAAGQLIHSGRNGVLVPGEDSADFTRAALSLAADAAWRTALGMAARTTAQGHGWGDVVRRFEALLTQAIDQVAVGTVTAAVPGPRGEFVHDADAAITRA
jgi:glycosyltransferase involved in cell wall biosynthesis